jgi:single-strand DNA-binding protein
LNDISVTIVGNLTDDPELRFTPTGAAVCKFRVASTPRYFDRTAGEWKDGEPTFLDCSAWRGLAEHIAESLPRGARVILTGNLKTQRWKSDGSGKSTAGETIERQQIDVFAIGPELTYATAKVQKMARSRDGQAAPDDPWAGASKTRPAGAPATSSFDDEPPF